MASASAAAAFRFVAAFGRGSRAYCTALSFPRADFDSPLNDRRQEKKV